MYAQQGENSEMRLFFARLNDSVASSIHKRRAHRAHANVGGKA